jgi:ribosomal-protein-alanine N-acetyltransferase
VDQLGSELDNLTTQEETVKDATVDDFSVLIRQATEDDLPRILEIELEAFRLEADSESVLLGFLEQCPEGFLVAQVGDEIAGLTIAYVPDGRPRFFGTAVASEFRTRRGIGTRLVMRQLSNFRKRGYSEIGVFVRCTNSISIRLFEKVGFKHVRTIRNFYSFPRGSARQMMKSLSGDGKASIRGPNLRDIAKDAWARVFEPRLNRGLHVAWFDDWRPVLDNALHGLPEMEDCPHELFRLIMQNPSSTRKRTALVMEGDGPVAVVGLRQKGRHWLPAMQGITPESIAPACDGFLFRALRALDVDARIADWPNPPPTSIPARNVLAVPMFNIDCQGDFEGYWRESGYMKSIRLARNRTKGFEFEVDRPGSAALIIAKWEEKWREHPDQQTIIASDLIVAAEYCQQRNQHHSFLILDDDVPVAGEVCFVHGNHLVDTAGFRDKRYDRHSVGTRILDLIVQWAAQHGFAKVELGGWYSYKAKWAPQDGEHWDFRICPLRQHLREQATWKARAVPNKLKALFHRLPVLSTAPDDRRDQCAGVKEPQEGPKIESRNPGSVHSPTTSVSRGGDD